jgi:two-component system, OmpR family, response regulator CpxR
VAEATNTLIPILLIDDDLDLCDSLTQLLRLEGFDIAAAHDGESGLREALSERHRLVILDVMLPKIDGRAVLRRLRVKSQIPVLMLTARGDEAERIAGLEGGADDYLPKPFNPRELVARIRAILKRKGETAETETLALGDISMHLKTRQVLQHDEPVDLTGAEFEILLLLLRNAGKTLSRDDIAEAALARPVGPLDRSIDNHISNLRKKLGAEYNGLERIRNIRGAGYCYTGEPRTRAKDHVAKDHGTKDQVTRDRAARDSAK